MVQRCSLKIIKVYIYISRATVSPHWSPWRSTGAQEGAASLVDKRRDAVGVAFVVALRQALVGKGYTARRFGQIFTQMPQTN